MSFFPTLRFRPYAHFAVAVFCAFSVSAAMPTLAQKQQPSAKLPAKQQQPSNLQPPRPEKPPALIDPAGPAVSLQTSEAMFDIAVALNSCGYDNGLADSD